MLYDELLMFIGMIGNRLLLLLLNACGRVADVMIFTFVSLMPVHGNRFVL